MTDWPNDDYEGWAYVHLLGHTYFKGWVSRAYLGGQPVLKVAIPEADGSSSIRYVPPGSLYMVRPSTAELCRSPVPVTEWSDSFGGEGPDDEPDEGPEEEPDDDPVGDPWR